MIMFVKKMIVMAGICLAFQFAFLAYAQVDDGEINVIVTVAESMFAKLKSRESKAVWGLLTEKSQGTIVSDTLKSLSKSDGGYSREQIAADFSKGGPISEEYWQGYLSMFDPDIALSQSAWSMGKVQKDRAEIKLLYKRSENFALLKMFKENGSWKVGLVETFWSRK
jgi:hypothetical protein